jgi:HK97 family phage major capsid protein
MPRIDELRERLEELNADAQAITAKAESEKRDLASEEREDLDKILKEFETVQADISRLEVLQKQTEDLTTGQGRKVAPPTPAAAADADDDDEPAPPPARNRRAALAPEPRSQPRIAAEPRDRKWGWRSLGDFSYAVRHACINGGSRDVRLERSLAATTYGTEGTGSDGGFAVPPDFKTEIMTKVMGEDSLLGRCDQLTSSSNNFTFPKDETTPWQTSGGILAYWENEAGTMTQSKPSLEQNTVRLNKVTALVPMTDELLEDAPAMDAYLRRKAPEKINFKISLAIVKGTGVGQPLGILNSPSVVSVAKESSQIADTLVGANVVKMWSRMYAPLRSDAIWLVQQDVEPHLLRLTLPGLDNTGNAVTGWGSHVYLPPNGLSSSPFGTLLGRPVIPTQTCETIGDKGDIIFVNLKHYLAVLKVGGLRTDVSMHLWFDQDITAFKFVMRIGGLPWWTSAISSRDGSNTLSWAVTLDERA